MATTTLTKEQSLALLKKATFDSDNDDEATRNVVMDIKSAALMNPGCKWEELLDCAPSAIYSIGCCYVVSSADEAAKITLEIKAGSKLRSESLRANLVRAGDMGFNAFRHADDGMDMIHQQSKITSNALVQVAEAMEDPTNEKSTLFAALKAIKRSAVSCHDAAAAIHVEFDAWLAFMSDLHEACEEKRTKTSKELASAETDIIVNTVMKKSQQEILHEAKSDVKRLKKTMATMEEKYKQACDAYPNEWNILTQEAVRSLLQVVGTAAQGYLNLSTGGMFAALATGGLAGGVPPQGGKPGVVPPGGTTPTQSNEMKGLMESYCHSTIGADMAHINVLMTLLTGGPNGLPNWEKIKAERDTVLANCRMITMAVKTYPDPAGNTYDQQYLVLIKAVEEVASWLFDELEQANNMNWQAPEATDPKVVSMVQKLREYTAAIQKIQNKVIGLGGNSGAALPLFDEIPTRDTGGESALAAAQHRLETTEVGLKHANELYQHSREAMAQKAARLAETEALLAELSNSKLSLEKIKDIIRKSIEVIAELQQQISNLNIFFARLGLMIDTALQDPIQRFLDSVVGSGTDQIDADIDNVSMGDFDMQAFRKMHIIHHIVNIRAYYSIFADISAMWLQLSAESVQPGINMCRRLSTMTHGSPAELESQSQALQNWSCAARQNVIKIASASQDEIKNHLVKRLKKIQAVSRQLVPSETRKTLEASSGEANKVIKEHIGNATLPKVKKSHRI